LSSALMPARALESLEGKSTRVACSSAKDVRRS
jgi:hypothetical protein